MSLTLVAVPIGNPEDITLRGLETLRQADLVIGEERKPLFRLFKEQGLDRPKDFRLLNEHTTKEEIAELAQLCAQLKVALITDCGTPGFSDPGAELVNQCRHQGTAVTSNPGASSLTAFISLCGISLKRFHFQGFLPRESDERLKCLRDLNKNSKPVIIMDTPYRLKKTLEQLQQLCPEKKVVLGMDLTKESERVLIGRPTDILKAYDGSKREFLALVYD